MHLFCCTCPSPVCCLLAFPFIFLLPVLTNFLFPFTCNFYVCFWNFTWYLNLIFFSLNLWPFFFSICYSYFPYIAVVATRLFIRIASVSLCMRKFYKFTLQMIRKLALGWYTLKSSMLFKTLIMLIQHKNWEIQDEKNI